MYKSRLQELCQKRSWELPEYSTAKMGLDHNPLFLTTVTVHGESFVTPTPARSSKLSQSDAAQIAFERLSAPPPDYAPAQHVMAESGSSEIDKFNHFLADLEKLQPSLQECEISDDDGTSQTVEDTAVKDVEHFYKKQLPRRNLGLPDNTCKQEGAIHACRFIEIDGETHDTSEYFCSTKEAELAAAKVPLSSLSESNMKEGSLVMYKNLLQEFCQKQGDELPVYCTTRTGEVHAPTFISTVVVSGESFGEQRGPTKKMAEMNAAKFAYIILKERKASQNSTSQHSILRGQSSSFSSFPPQSVSGASNLGGGVSEIPGSLATTGTPHDGLESRGHPGKKSKLHHETASLNKFPQSLHESIEVTQSSEISITTEDDAAMKEVQHAYKNHLQTLAQRRNLALPVYACKCEGNRFRCKVIIDGKAYETSETFQSTKQAEHAAAKLALISMSANGISEVQDDFVVYKNVLQEFTQKQGYALPKYTSEVSGGGAPMQTFISTVEVNGENFTGLAGQTKKLAEMNAAKVAYTVLNERMLSRAAVLKPSGHHASSSSMNRDRAKQDADAIELLTNNHRVASGRVDTVTRKSQDENERGGDPFPGDSSSSLQESSSGSVCSWTSDLNSPVPCDLTGMPANVIRIYPRSANIKFLDINIVLSDENWVALSSAPVNQSL